ncbi:ATP-binding protein [Sphingomonas sp. SUN019]|uniref:ATP-binding protein n=1 Tax=Sphingomonas sp. SUN019 TaxID=2937788 RepID=UPI00216419BD|nr:ATP-binding protein [Sphingomonas sp. SUN019]UVO50183.1 ATP-binding protein [Sphingomonas sp. SUN019]
MNRTSSEGAIILAPHGRDAAVAEAMLREAGLDAAAAADVPSLAKALRDGAGFAIVTEEAMRGADLRELAAFLADQAEWSDFPFIVLTARGGGLERNPGAVRLLETLGNVTFLERPFHPTTLISLARAARRARLRQYEARARLEDIREGQQRMRVALSAGGLGAWSLELQNTTLAASPECKAHYGRNGTDSFSYEELLDAVHPDDRARMRAAVQRSLESSADYDIEYRCVWPDGSTHWVQVNGRLEYSVAGRPLRMVGVSRDITARHRTESRRAALLALGDGLRQTLDPEAMSFIAAEILGKTFGVSRSGYGIIDPVAETITVERDWNKPGTDSLAGVLNFRDYGSYIEDLKRGDVVAIADARTDPRTVDGAAGLEGIHARAFINMPVVDHGDFVALLYLNDRNAREWSADDLTFVRDVADRTQAAIERRYAENSLAELAESLERQVEERTRESEEAQEQLRQAQKMEAVGQLTGGLAHDFNNLLTGISGGLELIKLRVDQGRSGEIGKYLEMAHSATKRAAALTHRLLAFSRRQTLDPKPTGINRLITSMDEFLRRSVGPAIELEVVGAAGLWTTLIDPNQLENALLNLCINARDAMPDGGRITIETANKWLDEKVARERDVPAGQYVALSVTDTGTGMSPDTISRAFDPFYTTKPLGEGTGLGLSMIYGFVRQSGGQVRIYSEVGQGTTMTLYFPRAYADDETEHNREGRLADLPSADGETVLVVDDEPAVRALITDVLGDLGYKTIEACDGPEGLALLKSRSAIELLVTDVGLPKGMNGRQLADAARVDRPSLKVLFITGYAENAVIGNGQLEPGMHVLTKPFAMDALANRVRELIAN